VLNSLDDLTPEAVDNPIYEGLKDCVTFGVKAEAFLRLCDAEDAPVATCKVVAVAALPTCASASASLPPSSSAEMLRSVSS